MEDILGALSEAGLYADEPVSGMLRPAGESLGGALGSTAADKFYNRADAVYPNRPDVQNKRMLLQQAIQSLAAQRMQAPINDRSQQLAMAAAKSLGPLNGFGKFVQAYGENKTSAFDNQLAAFGDMVKGAKLNTDFDQQDIDEAKGLYGLGNQAKSAELNAMMRRFKAIKDPITGQTTYVDIMATGGQPAAGGSTKPIAEYGAAKILEDSGVPVTPISMPELRARQKNDQTIGSSIQSLDSLDHKIKEYRGLLGKYNYGPVGGVINTGLTAAKGIAPDGTISDVLDKAGSVAPRNKADKISKDFSNYVTQLNGLGSRAGIRTLQFEEKTVPSPDKDDETNKMILNDLESRVKLAKEYNRIRAVNPRLSEANLGQLFNKYTEENPYFLENGEKNPDWKPYDKWAKEYGNATEADGAAGISTESKPTAAATARATDSVAFKDANEVKDAVRTGKLKKEEALAILKRDFGYQ